MFALLVSCVVAPSNNGGDSEVVWDCECTAEFEDAYEYFEQTDAIDICAHPRDINDKIEEVVEFCVSNLYSYDYYGINCSCDCDATGESCDSETFGTFTSSN